MKYFCQSRFVAIYLFFETLRPKADVVLDWNALMLDAIKSDDTAPTLSSRNLCILHTAIYDAIAAINKQYQPYHVQIAAPGDASIDAAAVGAARQVMAELYPLYEFASDSLFNSWLAGTSNSAPILRGLQLGQAVAFAELEARNDDGASLDIPYIPSNLPGAWQRTPPFYRPPVTPQWGNVTPFCLPEIETFLPPPPTALDSAEYAYAFNEVKALGSIGSTVRTAEQSQIAIFWSDFSYTAMPPGHWHEIAAAIAAVQGSSLEENARMFALLSLAQADAGIVCWAAKYRFNRWRPITAIWRADEDGNPETAPDSSWGEFLAAPPFPSYPSGHSTFSRASAEILTRFLGSDTISFSAGSDALPSLIRTYNSLSACANEIGMSRIFGGIHFKFDDIEGQSCGKRIGDFIFDNYLLDNRRLPSLRLIGSGDGSLEVREHGHLGAALVFEGSTDLIHWSPIQTNTAVSGGTIIHTPSSFKSQRYFRVTEPD